MEKKNKTKRTKEQKNKDIKKIRDKEKKIEA